MRILHVDTGHEMRGGQYQVLLLRDSLARAGYDQVLLAGDGIRSRLECEPTSWQSIRSNARRCDLIHAHDARAHTLALLHGFRRPIVVSRRVSFPVHRGLPSRWKYRRAAHFVAISEHVAKVLEHSGIPKGKISIVRDAVPDGSLPAGPRRTYEPPRAQREERFRVIAPKFEDPLKCSDLAVAACGRVNVPLCLSDRLVEDLPEADAMLYLTRSEGLGSAILLAMSLGVPTIASEVGGIPEIVTHESTGLLVRNEISSVVAALKRLKTEPRLRAHMAAAALALVRSDFTPERMMRQTAQVYCRVLGDSERSSSEDRS